MIVLQKCILIGLNSFIFLLLAGKLKGQEEEEDCLPTAEELLLYSLKELQDYNNETEITIEGIPQPGGLVEPHVNQASVDLIRKKDIRFLLYTRDMHQAVEIFSDDQGSLKNSKFDYRKETKIIIQGWLIDDSNNFCLEMKDAFLQVEDCNIITVTWESGFVYSIAKMAVKKVASQVTKFLNFLIAYKRKIRDKIHLLGHSLGVHIAGMAARLCKYQPVPWITGFDPSGPWFYQNNWCIRKNDAEFIDIIHSSGGFIGLQMPCGHVDFYPNGGSHIQPGCGFDIGLCSHFRAYKYYIASMMTDTPPFWTVYCKDYEKFRGGLCCKGIIKLGPLVSQLSRGEYYFYTGPESPFSLDKQSIWDHCWKRDE